MVRRQSASVCRCTGWRLSADATGGSAAEQVGAGLGDAPFNPDQLIPIELTGLMLIALTSLVKLVPHSLKHRVALVHRTHP